MELYKTCLCFKMEHPQIQNVQFWSMRYQRQIRLKRTILTWVKFPRSLKQVCKFKPTKYPTKQSNSSFISQPKEEANSSVLNSLLRYSAPFHQQSWSPQRYSHQHMIKSSKWTSTRKIPYMNLMDFKIQISFAQYMIFKLLIHLIRVWSKWKWWNRLMIKFKLLLFMTRIRLRVARRCTSSRSKHLQREG